MKASNEKADICQTDISVFVTVLSPNFHTHFRIKQFCCLFLFTPPVNNKMFHFSSPTLCCNVIKHVILQNSKIIQQ